MTTRFFPSTKPLSRNSSKNASTTPCLDEGSRKPSRYVRPLSCARAASGHAATAPPRSVMNSRRFIRSPRQRVHRSACAHRRDVAKVLADQNSRRLFNVQLFDHLFENRILITLRFAPRGQIDELTRPPSRTDK